MRLFELEKETSDIQGEEKEEADQEEELPLKRKKRAIIFSSDLVRDKTVREMEDELISSESRSQLKEVEKEIEKEQTLPIQRKRKRKVTVSPSDMVEDSDSETIAKAMEKRKKMYVSAPILVEDTIHEAAVKAIEQEHSKAMIVFERAEKRRQQQFLRDEVAAVDILQRETARRQQTARHYTLRSSPIIADTSGAGNSLYFCDFSFVSLWY